MGVTCPKEASCKGRISEGAAHRDHPTVATPVEPPHRDCTPKRNRSVKAVCPVTRNAQGARLPRLSKYHTVHRRVRSLPPETHRVSLFEGNKVNARQPASGKRKRASLQLARANNTTPPSDKGESNMSNADPLPRFAIVTCSDTRSLAQDSAGECLVRLIEDKGWECLSHVVVKDDVNDIAAAIVSAADEVEADVVLTCGGTGLSPRDVTPEATRMVCQREVPGIAEGMRAHSLAITNRAMLSRAICAQRFTETGSALVVNLPGSRKAAQENWEALVDVLPHAVLMMAGGGH